MLVRGLLLLLVLLHAGAVRASSGVSTVRRARCTSRNGMGDTHRENEIGFRVALTLDMQDGGQ